MGISDTGIGEEREGDKKDFDQRVQHFSWTGGINLSD